MSRLNIGLALGLLILSACAPADYATMSAPSVRVAIAQAQMTETTQAQDNRMAQILVDEATQGAALTQTAVPPRQTIAAGTAQAVALAAEADSRHATEIATAEYGSAAATSVAIVTFEYLSAQSTADAFAESQLAHYALMQSVETRTAADQAALLARAQALAVGWWVLIVGGSLALVVVALFATVRVAGPGLHHAGKMAAEAIRANGDAKAAEVTAEAQAQASNVRAAVFSHRGALIHVSGDGQASLLYHVAPTDDEQETAPAQPPMINDGKGSHPLLTAGNADLQELSNFLWRCVRKSGGQAERINTIPSDDKLGMGAETRRRYVQQLVDMKFVEVIPNTGTIITAYASLADLARAVANGARGASTPSSPTPSG